MATQVQNRRGSTAEHSTFTGAVGEVTVDTDKEVVVVHDGTTAGGYPQMRENGSNSALALGSAATPSLKFTGDTNTGIYSPGADQVAISTNSSERIRIGANGEIGIAGANYGTSGQVLTSGGSGATPSWQTLSVSANSITQGNTTAEVIDTGSDGRFVVTTEGTERLRVDSSGRLGVGTTSPGDILTVQENKNAVSIASIINTNAGVAAQARFKVENGTSSGSFGICGSGFTTIGVFPAGSTYLLSESSPSGGGVVIAATEASSTIKFATGGTSERARIDSSGRLLVGTSSSRQTVNSGNSQVQIHDQGTVRNLDLVGTANSPYGPEMLFIKARSGTNIVQNGDVLGEIKFIGYDGTADRFAGKIALEVDGTPGAGDMPGRLVFSTTADGASSPTERMRIDSTGLVTLAGPGIKFPATQVASADANVLDDYEEGTFTPTVIGSSTAGSASYNSQSARYTKVGRLVYFEIYLFWGGGTGTGNLVVAGLPFTCNSAGIFPAVTVAGQDNIASSAGTYLNAYVNNNTTNILIMQAPTGGGARASVAYDTAGELLLAGMYSV